MDSEKAKETLKAISNIFRFEIIEADYEKKFAKLKGSWFDNLMYVDFFRDGAVTVSIDGGSVTTFQRGQTTSQMEKSVIWFVAENMKVFSSDHHILEWGFNCNTAYVGKLNTILSE
jgi:hypothetical protein